MGRCRFLHGRVLLESERSRSRDRLPIERISKRFVTAFNNIGNIRNFKIFVKCFVKIGRFQITEVGETDATSSK